MLRLYPSIVPLPHGIDSAIHDYFGQKGPPKYGCQEIGILPHYQATYPAQHVANQSFRGIRRVPVATLSFIGRYWEKKFELSLPL